MRTAQLLRDEAAVLDEVVATALAGATASRSPTSPRCRPRSRASSCAAWPRTPRAACAPARPARLDDILALGDGALDLGDGARAVVDGGVLRVRAHAAGRAAPGRA